MFQLIAHFYVDFLSFSCLYRGWHFCPLPPQAVPLLQREKAGKFAAYTSLFFLPLIRCSTRHLLQRQKVRKLSDAEDCRERIVQIHFVQTEKTTLEIFRHGSVRTASDQIRYFKHDYSKRDKFGNA